MGLAGRKYLAGPVNGYESGVIGMSDYEHIMITLTILGLLIAIVRLFKK